MLMPFFPICTCKGAAYGFLLLSHLQSAHAPDPGRASHGLRRVSGHVPLGGQRRVYRTLETLTVVSDKGPAAVGVGTVLPGTSCRELTQRNVKLGRRASDREAGIVSSVTAAVNAKILWRAGAAGPEFHRLDDMIGLHNFDDHALYGYAMKLQLLERQRTFRYESGKRAFDGLMQNIRQQVSSL